MEFAVDLTFPSDERPPAPLDAGAAEEERRRVEEISARTGHLDRLTADELEKVTAFQVAVEDLEARRKFFQTTPVEQTFQGQVIPLVTNLLQTDARVRTVMNIGMRYGFVDHVLASRFPNVRFVGVDFMPNLAEMNAEFARPNLSFVPGYALEQLEAGRIRGDLVMFSSTCPPISNPELRRYMRALASRCQYLVLNEPVLHHRDGRAIDPLSLPVDHSVPVRLGNPSQPNPALHRVHNYKAITEDAGFHVLHYRVSPFPPFEDLLLQLVARSPVSSEKP